jgi:hypothetical protein
MQPLPRPSVSPLPSYCTVTPVRRTLGFAESLGQILRWATGRRRPAPQREREIEARIVERLAAELDSLDINSVDSNP